MKREIEDCKWFHSIRLSLALFMLIKTARGSSRKKKEGNEIAAESEFICRTYFLCLRFEMWIISTRSMFKSPHHDFLIVCARLGPTKARRRALSKIYSARCRLLVVLSLNISITDLFSRSLFFFPPRCSSCREIESIFLFFSVFIANKHSLEQRRESSALCVSSSNGNNSSAI